ncbi:MrcB family domain-containing protein [Brevundimonas sp. DC300-4]|uniref:MrcB family domain-containing protein n=1 Tax=Brevundimonas sp. DC300-4 TaxID=2804594 RepID=UPI003CF1ED87
MIETLRQISQLQPAYSPSNTPAMQARGSLIRSTLVGEVRGLAAVLSSELAEYGDDFGVEASDGIGRKTEAPWVRFFSRRMSPTPRDGFYVVIHFSADGSAFWITVGCGSTVWNGGDLRALPDAELQERTQWARSVVDQRFGGVGQFTDTITLGAKAALPKTFEKATALARRFHPTTTANADVEQALIEAASYLREVYRAQAVGSHLSLAEAAEIEMEALARPNANSAARQGLGLSGPERRAIELQAMKVAQDWLEGLGFSVKDTSKNSPFDFAATKNGDTFKIEVKGTTGASCDEFFMTKNEVDLHQKEAGATGLALVSNIRLVRKLGSPPEAAGGECFGEIGWNIASCELRPVAFRVIRPRASHV